ncbi:MAG: hypothetical protein ACREPR_09515 [Brasilonema sp.]
MTEQNSEKENTSFENIENELHNYLDVDYKVNKAKNVTPSNKNEKKSLCNRRNFILITALSIMTVIPWILFLTEILIPQESRNQTEQKSTFVIVKIIQENNNPVEGAIVTFPNTKFTIIEETNKNKSFNSNRYHNEQATDLSGSTIIELPNNSDVDISITKPGFKPSVISLKVTPTLKNKIIILNTTN